MISYACQPFTKSHFKVLSRNGMISVGVWLFVLIASMPILAACSAPATSAAPTPTTLHPGATSTIPPTQTAMPTDTPTPTLSLPVADGTSIPVSEEGINSQTLPRLTLLSERHAGGYDLSELVISQDSRLLADYIGNQSITIQEMDSGAKVWSLETGAVRVQRPISFSKDGKLAQIVCGIYDITDFRLIHQFTNGPYLKDSCDSLVFFPDGTKVIVGMPLRKFYEANIWTIDGSQHVQTITMFINGESIPGQQYTLSPDGSLLLVHQWVSLWAKNLWLFQVSDGTLVKKIEYKSNDKLGIQDLHWSFSPDGTLLAVDITRADMYQDMHYLAEMPHMLEIWRLSDMTLVQQLDGMGELCGLTFSPTGDLVAERSFDQLTFRSTTDWNVVSRFHISGCTPVVFSPNGKLLVTGAQQGIESSTIQIYGIAP